MNPGDDAIDFARMFIELAGSRDPKRGHWLEGGGHYFVQVGKLALAERWFQQAEQAFREAGLPRDEARELANRACVKSAQGQPEEALALLQAAVKIFVRVNAPEHHGLCLACAADLYRVLGRPENARRLYQEAIGVFQTAGLAKHADSCQQSLVAL